MLFRVTDNNKNYIVIFFLILIKIIQVLPKITTIFQHFKIMSTLK